MNAPVHTWFCWAPRALAIAFALFLSLFALDVFGEHRGFLETAIGLLIHLTPVWIVLAALAVAWRLEVAGGLLFLALATWYVVMTVHGPVTWSLVIAGPALLIGILFLMSAWLRSHSSRYGGTC